MNKLQNAFENKGKKLLNIYVTAGYPEVDDTLEILYALHQQDVDMVELGMPFSDPLADGLTIQQSSEKALQNGMSVELLFETLRKADKNKLPPLIAMGYMNQVMQYGEEKFVKDAKESGIDGLIIPDLPLDIYENVYQPLFEQYDMGISFLITPETKDDRILKASKLSSNFLYVVSSSVTTGGQGGFAQETIDYLQRINKMDLEIPKLVGFGIHDKMSFDVASKYGEGAIIGSAFIRMLSKVNALEKEIEQFVGNIRT